jgi:tetratricopeptide (TPR) repeat protein
VRAFIVRPFGKKQEVDFDRVQKELIDPALADARITGDTTAEILEAGNIRSDMFQLLLLADLVVADVSIDNANVFYELGIRHALRSRRTVLIRARGGAAIPFDLRTDRYLEYNLENPGEAVPSLSKALRQTTASERVDSPVFLLLSELREPDRSRLIPVPREFREEVERATKNREPGRLGLLGLEAHGFQWELGGFRLVGQSLFQLRAFTAARRVWERVRALYQEDVEANLMLGTVYQRLGDVTASDQAMRRVLDNNDSSTAERAEASALLARNEKSRLTEGWTVGETADRQKRALRSRYLLSAYEHYRRGFLLDLNHYYSGLNALAMVSVALALIAKQPEVWLERFDAEEEAESERRKLDRQRGELASAVGLCLQAEQERAAKGGRDIWFEISIADHQFLTTDRPTRAAAAYERALAGASSFHVESARAQLLLYRDLGIFEERVAACLAAFPAEPPKAMVNLPSLRRAIVFTGHMVDAPGRATPRFPQAKVSVAAAAIDDALSELTGGDPAGCIGFAGGASGGDLLFHEACEKLGIVSRLRITLPKGPFIARSVAPADADWESRFHAVFTRLQDTLEILSPDEQLPGWLTYKADYNVWGRTNVWLLEEGIASGAPEVNLLALWNGEPGDGPGGTGHLIELASQEGVSTRVLDTKQLFGL